MNTTHDDRNVRVTRIVEAFNSFVYDADGACKTPNIDHVRKDILAMLNDKRAEYTKTGKAGTLALEVSQIVRCIGNDHARNHFHRVLQFM